MLETLDAAAVRRWCGRGLAALRAHQREIDDLNVYPVPDGDTGTNLVLTLTSAAEALDGGESPPGGPDPASAPDAAVFDAAVSEAAGSGGAVSSGAASGGAASGAAASGGAASGGASDSGAAVSGVAAAGGAGAVAAGGAAVEAATLGQVMRRMARGALLGARGNSGVIVSQILRGMADAFAEKAAVRGTELAAALRRASDAAYQAVARPVEGTVLSVVAAAAEGAARIKSDDLLTVARAAARSAAEALARTPQQLPILARAGVVDAGGRGLVVLLDALVETLSNASLQPGSSSAPDSSLPYKSDKSVIGVFEAVIDSRAGALPAASALPARSALSAPVRVEAPPGQVCALPAVFAPAEHSAPPAEHHGHDHDAGGDHGGFGYEVQYLLRADDAAVETLRTTLDALGDSLVVVGTGDGVWNVHVHVDDIGAAVEAGVDAGRPYRISVTALTGARAERAAEPSGRGAVVVAAGDGLAALFGAEGAVVVDRNPSTREMVGAIAATGAKCVVLLPNDANTHAVATAAAREAAATGRRVSVVPTRSPVQALAALAVRDPQRLFADDVIAMAEAAGACRYGEVCTASREALTVAGRCRPGDLLGLVDGEVHVIGAELGEVCRRLVDRMLGGGGELVTLVLGADAPPGMEEALRRHLAHAWPFAEVQVLAGGQPRYHLLVGVE